MITPTGSIGQIIYTIPNGPLQSVQYLNFSGNLNPANNYFQGFNNDTVPLPFGTPVIGGPYSNTISRAYAARPSYPYNITIPHTVCQVIGLVMDPVINVGAVGNVISDGILPGSYSQWAASFITSYAGLISPTLGPYTFQGLSWGARYYLADFVNGVPVTGMATNTPPYLAGSACVELGIAITPNIFSVNIKSPILL